MWRHLCNLFSVAFKFLRHNHGIMWFAENHENCYQILDWHKNGRIDHIGVPADTTIFAVCKDSYVVYACGFVCKDSYVVYACGFDRNRKWEWFCESKLRCKMT